MKFILVAISLFISVNCLAGTMAVTDTGETVLLNDDGTWKYFGDHKKSDKKIEVNNTVFTKPADSTFLLKSKNNTTAYWLNTDKWNFNRSLQNEDAEYEFKLKGEDLYGLAITEAVQIQIASLADIALDNARLQAPDTEVITKEYRKVNGHTVLYMEFKGTIKGMKVTYLGYYYSDTAGSTQYLLYTGTNLVEQYRDAIQNFLNGFTVQ